MRSPEEAGIRRLGVGRSPRPRYGRAAPAAPLVTSGLRCRAASWNLTRWSRRPPDSAADRRPPTAESGKAPPCMRWRGLTRPRCAQPTSCLASLEPRAARRCQIPVRGTGFPAPPMFPGCPEVVPVSNGEAFLLALRARAQDPVASKFGFSAIHTVPTETGQLSAPDTGYPPAYTQHIHK